MKSRPVLVAAVVLLVLGVASAVVAQTNIAARDALYDRPASFGPDEIYGGAAYSAQPWPSILTIGVIFAVVGAATLLILSAARAASRRRARVGD